MSTQQIYNYHKVNERIITAGQPNEEQLKAAASEGFATVINLATIQPANPLEDEAGLVRSLGMNYHHIPVEWKAPKESDFEAFERVMQHPSHGKMLIHCAANYRVTAFYSLYALKHLGWSGVQAEEFRELVWKVSGYPVWETFVADITDRITR